MELRLRKVKRDTKMWEPGEVKYLSNQRKRNQRDSLSSDERNGNSLNHSNVKTVVVVVVGSRERCSQSTDCE